MEITKTNGVIYFKEGESTVAIPQSILQTATIEKSGGGVNIIYSKGGKDTELNILYANVTTPVVTSSDSLISELYSLIGQPLEATVLYGTPVNAVATQRVYTPSTIVAGDTVTVGDKVYTFTDQLSDPLVEGEVVVGVSDGDSLTYLHYAINANMDTYGSAHSCSEANVYFIATAKDATTLTVTAKVKGIAGNSLVVDTDNGDWDTTPTVEGVDGTVGDITTIYQDEDYIYTTLGNTISGANWNKIAKASL